MKPSADKGTRVPSTSKPSAWDLSEEDLRDFGQELRAIRGGRPQTEVADSAMISPSLLSLIERGKHIPTPRSLSLLEPAYGLSPGDLIAALKRTQARRIQADTGRSYLESLQHAFDMGGEVASSGALYKLPGEIEKRTDKRWVACMSFATRMGPP